MKRTLLIIIAVAAVILGFVVARNWGLVSMLVIGPRMGSITESWQTSGQAFRLRVDAHSEQNSFVPGAYYVFRSAPKGSDTWRDVMTFRHDDPAPVPRDNVRFVDDRTTFVFMGWMYAVTTDGGATWSVWDAGHDLPNWQCCNYQLITEVRLDANGIGTMTLNPIRDRRGEVPQLRTSGSANSRIAPADSNASSRSLSTRTEPRSLRSPAPTRSTISRPSPSHA